MGSMGEQSKDYDVIVVGGGFCGVWLLKHLRDEGFSTHLFEHGTGLGGIWYWNKYVGQIQANSEQHTNCDALSYPGARVDTSAPTYQLTAKETWDTWEWKVSRERATIKIEIGHSLSSTRTSFQVEMS